MTLDLPAPSSVETTYYFPAHTAPVFSYSNRDYRVSLVTVTEFPDDPDEAPPQASIRGIALTAKGEPDRRAQDGPIYNHDLAQAVIAAHQKKYGR